MKRSRTGSAVVFAACFFLVMAGCSKSPTGPSNNPYGNTANGYFSITIPNYMDSVLLGSTISLGWETLDSTLIGTNVNVSLYQGNNLVHSYGSYANAGSDTIAFTIGAGYAGSGADYHFRITSTADTFRYDMSYYFRVYSAYNGTYIVTSPTMDSTWSTSTVQTVQWIATGNLGATTTICLYYDTSLVSTITTGANTASGTYTFTLGAYYENSNRCRIRVFNTADRGLSAFSDFFSIQGGVDADSYESDGFWSTAKSITADGVAQSRTLTFRDTDWVSFNAVSGTTYTIQTSGNLDTYLFLYQSDGVTLITSDDDDGAGNNALISWTCTASGTYYFLVRGYSIYWMGNYSVSVQ